MREFLDDFKQTIGTAAGAMSHLSEAQSERASAPGKWSPKQVIGHLIDSAANNHGRFVRAQLQDDLTFPGYAQEEWVDRQHYQSEPWKDLIELWRLYNLHLAHLMEQVSETDLTRPRAHHNLDEIAWKTVARNEPVTLEYFMRDYVAHLKNHLRQILVNGAE
jgi:hypothetical protein